MFISFVPHRWRNIYKELKQDFVVWLTRKWRLLRAAHKYFLPRKQNLLPEYLFDLSQVLFPHCSYKTCADENFCQCIDDRNFYICLHQTRVSTFCDSKLSTSVSNSPPNRFLKKEALSERITSETLKKAWQAFKSAVNNLFGNDRNTDGNGTISCFLMRKRSSFIHQTASATVGLNL